MRTRRKAARAGRPFPAAWPIAVAAVLALAAACSGGAGRSAGRPMASIGTGEGSLHLLTLPGYTEDGSTDPRVNWVSSFEKRTGCHVSIKQVNTGGELIHDFESGSGNNYDGVIAPPDVGARLIAAGDVAPLNTQLLTGYTAINRDLRTLPGIASGGKIYGVPFGWTSYTIGYNSSSVKTAPAGWGALFNPSSAAAHAGRITLPDSPFTIALAAEYLRSAEPALKITNPYELTASQLGAVVSLLRGLSSSVRYWSSNPSVIAQFASGQAVLGSVLPSNVDALARAGQPVASAAPAQGTTGQIDSWMMDANAQDPNCMYQWLTWSITEFVQRLMAAWLHLAPVNPAACDALGSRFCGLYHVKDPAYISNVAFVQLPVADCGNGKKNCTTWTDWQNAWNKIRS